MFIIAAGSLNFRYLILFQYFVYKKKTKTKNSTFDVNISGFKFNFLF